MTTQTQTLADFLLARIAEDETDLRESRISEMPEWWAPDAWSRERGLAECEAKRRIVEELQTVWPEEWSDTFAGTTVLRLLALPYADHPDFREGWRP